jgi:Flp pilus assembly protein TadG
MPSLMGCGWRARICALVNRWRGDDRGVTAIEFALVAMPFVLLLFGIMSVCLFYFANFSIENAVWQAARAIRTGQLQQSQGAYAGAVTNADRKTAFKKAMCDRAPTFLDCKSKAVVIVQSNANFTGFPSPAVPATAP